jgi:hypothetical protein
MASPAFGREYLSGYNELHLSLTCDSGLVRFVPSSGPSRILIGQLVQHEVDVGKAVRNGQRVDVAIFSGTSVLQPGTETGDVESIERILSPLAQNEVGTIRCIGLNVSTLLTGH